MPSRVATVVAFILITASCSTTARDRSRPRPPEQRGALEAARAFVGALNDVDPELAASLIDWDVWVAEDARLKFLLHELRRRARADPPAEAEREERPIEGSDVTLGAILDADDAPQLVARVSRDRFKSVMIEDFAPANRKMDARLAAWNLDRVDRSATVFMPNGQTDEMQLLRRAGQWRLVPRWYP